MNNRSTPAHDEPASPRPDPGGQPPSAGDSGRVITLVCDADHAAALTETAWIHGATGVAELTDGCPPGSVRLVVGADGADTAALLAAQLHADGRGAPVSVTVADDTWADAWRARATPERAGPFGIRLADHAHTTAPLDIVIEPGPTFGFGHASTLLALELLGAMEPPLGRVVDLGTGSGVLAIAAARLGATTVTAVDIDPDAVTTCRANAERNGAVVDVRCSDAGSAALPVPADGYDLVLVNVTAAVQLALAGVVSSATAPDAVIVVSGVLTHQASAVVAAYGRTTVIDGRERDGWIALALRC